MEHGSVNFCLPVLLEIFVDCVEILFLEVGGRGRVIHILGCVTMVNANFAPETLKLENIYINNLTKYTSSGFLVLLDSWMFVI